MSKLPAKTNNSIFSKIKGFFSNIFFNYTENTEPIQNENINKIEIKNQEIATEFNDSLKVEVDNKPLKDLEREKFLKKIEENPKLLYDLPIEKLMVLEDYYDKLIAIEEEKNKKLKIANSEN